MKVMLPLCDLLMLEARVVDWYLKTKVLYMIVTAHAIVMIREDTGSSISSHYSNHHKSEFGRSTWRLTQLSPMFHKFPFFSILTFGVEGTQREGWRTSMGVHKSGIGGFAFTH